MDMVVLAQAAQVLVRDERHVQCGVDSRRAGIIEVPDARAVATALRELRQPTARTEVIARLCEAGLPPLAAASLLHELLAYRVLRVPSHLRRPVTIVGRSPLARLSADLLRQSGLTVRHALGARDLAQARGPVLVIDCADRYAHLSPLLLAHCPTFLPALLIDAQGIIGPLRLRGAGPCPLCYVLHRNEEDPRWFPVLAQRDSARSPATVLHATAARLSALGAWLAGVQPEPPGHAPMTLRPGEVLRLSPYSPGDMEERSALAAHPRCVLCAPSAVGVQGF
ncbi:hypothetical protein Clow_00630 [Corynebacterium lowii]|uniref:Bacteriocin biosynthesis cyclodehydratase domain protein n=2 Tax=Corynebacterium lowii TaxID=1544413 RepID=A0A0Q0UGN7_9CORY|nr:hypothetical protein Clow_00630 [Corynebacterium lowii]